MKNFIQKIFNFFGYNLTKIKKSYRYPGITGTFKGWQQLQSLPEIDTLIDVGVGPDGSEDIYNRFKNANLILIDPLDEAREYANKLKENRKVDFFQIALGREDNTEKNLYVQKEKGCSSFLESTPLFIDYDYCTEVKKLKIKKFDTILEYKPKFGKIGIKIDVEGFELDIILGATEILKHTKFVIAEVRHCQESLKGAYKLHEFMNIMKTNNFTLSKILTAKSSIADLCFQANNELF
jgi:FkbM family methyltransferase